MNEHSSAQGSGFWVWASGVGAWDREFKAKRKIGGPTEWQTIALAKGVLLEHLNRVQGLAQEAAAMTSQKGPCRYRVDT